MPLIEIGIILLLIVLNGALSLAEIAIVSSRKTRLQRMAEEGHDGARTALDLVNAPNDLLATVQLGITLVGVLAGAFGGATLSDSLAVVIAQVPMLAPYAEGLAIGAVVITITYLSIVVGELAPKRLALNQPEPIAAVVAGAMTKLARLTSPAVKLLSWSTDIILRLLRSRPSNEPAVTDEEISLMIAQGAQAGVFLPAEADIVRSVFHLADERVSAIMTPRTEVHCLDLHSTPDELRQRLADSPRSRLPVVEGSLDRVLGIVHTRDLLSSSLSGEPFDLTTVTRRALFVPETMPALKLLERFKQCGAHLALVVDEYGGIAGLVTLTDVLEAIVGGVAADDQGPEPTAIHREDGSWLVDGLLPLRRFEELVGVDLPDAEDDGAFHTVGGLIMARLGRVPSAGDHFTYGGLRFEVMDMDENRVDKVLVGPPVSPVRS
ncbi:MAG: hemolysin family protein [Actinomycetota bacterium]